MEQGKCLPPCQRPCSCAGIFLMPPVGRCMNISIVPMKKAMAGTNSGFHIRKNRRPLLGGRQESMKAEALSRARRSWRRSPLHQA